MGRLDDIIARNRNPGKHAKDRFPLGIGLAVFVFIILCLMVFTDLDESPDAKPDAKPSPSAPAKPDHVERRVNGIYLSK